MPVSTCIWIYYMHKYIDMVRGGENVEKIDFEIWKVIITRCEGYEWVFLAFLLFHTFLQGVLLFHLKSLKKIEGKELIPGERK